ncbi:MAG: DUF2141 domain-containing protein [Gammaproteobacteria bacterium]|nr:DUF2141 domain-containing protein [Gammaproteobacteria bacterium]
MNKLLAWCFLLLVSSNISAAEIRIRVSGIDGEQGKVRVALFHEAEKTHFPKQIDKISIRTEASIQENHADLLLTDIPPGRYAAFVFHDRNNNEIMDHSWIGFPEESFGFIRNYQVRIIPPDFEDVMFTLGEETVQFDVMLQSF